MLTTRALHPDELGFGRLFSGIRDAVVVADVATERVVLWNPKATAVFGYPLDEALGLPLEKLVPERLRQAHRKAIARYRSSGRGALIESQRVLELPALHRDGREINVEMTLTPIDEPEIGDRYVLAIVRDVTERTRAREELQQCYEQEHHTTERLRETQQLKDDFLAVIAHDLQSPITVVTGLAHLLEQSWEKLDDARRRELLGLISTSAHRQTELVEGIVQIASIEAGRFHYDMQVFDLSELISYVVREQEFVVGAGRIKTAIPDDLPLAKGDPQRHAQILSNLITNASKFSSPVSPIAVEVSQRADTLQISVRDQGVGISSEDIGRIFDKFYRLNKNPMPEKAGAGLGLYICKKMVEEQGGEISARSEPGRGSTFTYTARAA